jgi:hypothetical protein
MNFTQKISDWAKNGRDKEQAVILLNEMLTPNSTGENMVTVAEVYTFAQLPDDVKEKVCAHWEIFYGWHEHTTEYIKEILEAFGMQVPKKDWIAFDLDRSNYCAFEVSGNASDIFTAKIAPEDFGEEMTAKLTALQTIDTNLLEALNGGMVDVYFSTQTRREYLQINTRQKIDYDTPPEMQDDAEKAAEEIESLIEVVLKSLESLFLKMLRDEYEYQTSLESIAETAEANDYKFNLNGEIV